MKKIILTVLVVLVIIGHTQKTEAQIPVVSLISSAIKKVLTAIDLKVQELQNQTIALQNEERSLENELHLNSLNNISGWLNKEKSLYQEYYKELAAVKTVIADYDEVRRIMSQQEEMVREYNMASTLFHQDRHFSAAEFNQMSNIYSGILREGIRNLNEVLLAVQSFSTQMSDAERIARIHGASAGMQKDLDNLRQFNNSNVQLSLERAKDEQDRQEVLTIYGIK